MRKVTTLLSTLALATTLAAQNLPQTERQYLSVYHLVGSCKALVPISMESPFMAKHFPKALLMRKECINMSSKFPRSFAGNR